MKTKDVPHIFVYFVARVVGSRSSMFRLNSAVA